jgi:methionyl aminopeptidase
LLTRDLSSYIKTPEAIEKMRIAGKLAADVLVMIEPYVQAGVTTEELDQRCHDYIVNEQSAIPAPLNYKGFPKSICTSLNHVVCHGIPGSKKLKNGDMLNIDITVIKDGYHGDTSKMFFIGKPSVAALRVSQVAQECLYLAIEKVKPGVGLKSIGAAIEAHAKKNKMSTVREFCGHGLGTVFHEENFNVLHYDLPGIPEMILQPGLTFTIEPMINFGRRHIKILGDGWTAITKDRSLSAQWEHTLVVTETGCDVLTKRAEEEGVL